MDKLSPKSCDAATLAMLEQAGKEGLETAWERLKKQEPQCGFGQLGLCCRHCNMGPCRIDPFGEGPARGVCGADADTMVARHLLRAIAAGAAAHSDHGRDVVETLCHVAEGKARDYGIKDRAKLLALAAELGIATDGREDLDVAKEVAGRALDEFGMRKGSLDFINRVPAKRRELWDSLGITPPRHRPGSGGNHAPYHHGRGQRLREPGPAGTAGRSFRRLGRVHVGHRTVGRPFRHATAHQG